MSFIGAAIGAVASIGGGLLARRGASKAAHEQQDASKAAAAANAAERKPWTDAAKAVLPQLQAGVTAGGQFNKPFTMADAANAPAMQFALQQGQEAIGNTAAAKGGLLSGNAVADATKFAEGTAAQFENQAFNQNMAQNQLALGGMESLSQSAISTGVNPTADANANAILASGGAQAAGTVAGTNAMTQGLSGAANALDRGGAFDALGKIFGGGDTTASPDVGSYSSIPGAGVDYSDKRLKEDMELVGHTHDGLPIYVYRMKSGGPKKMGVMAQDVEKVNPGAVTQDRQGYKMVDYSRVS